jgi:hypothetical protein
MKSVWAGLAQCCSYCSAVDLAVMVRDGNACVDCPYLAHKSLFMKDC